MAQKNTYTVTAQGDTQTTYLTKCVVDNDSDINTLPTDWLSGSRATVINTGNVYILDNQKQWKKLPRGGGSSGGGSETVDTAAIIAEAVRQSNVYTDEKIAEIQGFSFKIVNALPTTDIDDKCIYFVSRNGDKPGEHMFYQYIYNNGSWEKIGGTETDLSAYWTSQEVKDYVDSMFLNMPIATLTAIGCVKPDGKSILIDTEGTISVSSEYVKENAAQDTITDDDIANLFK